MVMLDEMKGYLDEYLHIADVPDWKDAMNGLQVEGSREVSRVAFAVDACEASIAKAAEWHADLLVVHHGLFWGTKQRLVGAAYRKVALMVQSKMALYSCHTPLDAHEEVGNNVVLCRLLGLVPSGRWAPLEGVNLGVYADCAITLADLRDRLATLLSIEPIVARGGAAQLRRVGILTGAGADWVDRARLIGICTLVTGEGPHHTFLQAEELGMNLLYCGHYATETVGLKALASHLERVMGVTTTFLDHPTGL